MTTGARQRSAQGEIEIRHKVIAKVSRREVALQFLEPAAQTEAAPTRHRA